MVETPVEIRTLPLTPETPALAVIMDTEPEEDASPRPLEIVTDPPVATDEDPPAMSTLPPTSLTGS